MIYLGFFLIMEIALAYIFLERLLLRIEDKIDWIHQDIYIVKARLEGRIHD